jgi:NADPH-dependent 2,4-dienoyl-CoA reductase/sulfur reductase-like enzyme
VSSVPRRILIVGAGLGGWRLAEGLRREGFAGEVTLLGAEGRPPYDRPPLSKQVPAITCFESPTAATDVLRTMDDAERLVAAVGDLRPGSPVVVIGGGFIGAEVATSLKSRGLEPIVLEAAERPLLGALGARASGWLERLAGDFGVELRANQSVRDVIGERGDLRVELADGDVVAAPIVVEAVGAQIRTEWLEGSGLELNDGVVVDEHLRAADGIRALGDVARFRWRHGPFDEVLRVEHWQGAIDHAAYLATAIASGEDAAASLIEVPYFWSDQYGKKIQVLGHPAPSDDVELVLGAPGEGQLLALYSRDGVLNGALALSAPRALMRCRDAIAGHERLEDALRRRAWEG